MPEFNFKTITLKSERQEHSTIIHLNNLRVELTANNFLDRNNNIIKEMLSIFLKEILEIEKMINEYENYDNNKSFFKPVKEDFKIKLFNKIKDIEKYKHEIRSLLDEYKLMTSIYIAVSEDDENDTFFAEDRLNKIGEYYYEYLQQKIFHIDDIRINIVLNWMYSLESKRII